VEGEIEAGVVGTEEVEGVVAVGELDTGDLVAASVEGLVQVTAYETTRTREENSHQLAALTAL
jgi:hypothetical protein